MGVTKSELFSESQNELAAIARVLAHPARIAILEQLLRSRTCICTGLVRELGLAQATISQHLREMRDAGLIKGTVEGVSMCYCINEERWSQIRTAFNELFSKYLNPAHPCC